MTSQQLKARLEEATAVIAKCEMAFSDPAPEEPAESYFDRGDF